MQVKYVTHDEFEELFPTYYAAKDPVFLHGNIGIGKSDTIRRCAKREADRQGREIVDWDDLDKEEKVQYANGDGVDDIFLYVDIRMASIEPSDLRGLPDYQDGYTEWKPSLWVAAVCNEGAAGLVFLDEANLAPQLVQSVFYQVVLDRKISQHTLADGVYVIGAGNVTEDEAHIHDMAGPLRDRFAHLRLEKPDSGTDGSWIEWAVENDIDPRIIGFIGSDVGRKHLYGFDESDADRMAFPTPRSWEKVNDLLNAAGDADEHVLHTLVASHVGPGVATEFDAFLAAREDFDVQVYIDNPTAAAELNDQQFDKAHARLSAIGAAHGEGEVDVATIVEMAKVLDAEYASYLLTISRVHSPDEQAFRGDIRNAIQAADDSFAEDILRVVS